MPARTAGSPAKPGGADEPAVGPGTVVDLPDSSVGLLPSGFDGCGGNLGGADAVGTDPVVAGGGREEQERFAERIELELAVDVVADQVVATRVAGQVEAALIGNGRAVDAVGRGQRRVRRRGVGR